MSRYLTWGVMIDTEGLTDGDVDDFRRALSRIEADFAGVDIIGFCTTDRLPVFSVKETPRRKPSLGVADYREDPNA